MSAAGCMAADSSSSGSSSCSDCCESQCSSGSCCSSGRLQDSEPGCVSVCQRERHQCVTSDGWHLHILHVHDPAAQASCSRKRPQHPVLMLPGLASSGEHTFDLLPETSLVESLAARGYDVWVADLRGEAGWEWQGLGLCVQCCMGRTAAAACCGSCPKAGVLPAVPKRRQATDAAKSRACSTAAPGGPWTHTSSTTSLLSWSLCWQPVARSKCTASGTQW